MNLRGKSYVENQKKVSQEKLIARRALLLEKGSKEDTIKKDAVMRKLKAELKKSNSRLAAIAAQEKLNMDRAQATVDKRAAGKVDKKAAKKAAKEQVPEKKEKKGKKEKREKKPEQAPSES